MLQSLFWVLEVEAYAILKYFHGLWKTLYLSADCHLHDGWICVCSFLRDAFFGCYLAKHLKLGEFFQNAEQDLNYRVPLIDF